MMFYHRKLLDPSKPKDDDDKFPGPPKPKDDNKPHAQTQTTHHLAILTLFFIATLLICLAYYAYRRWLLRRNPIAAHPHQPDNPNAVAENGFFIDRLQGPAEDHHVWHIRTVGLSESSINSIAEFKFKKRGDVSFGNSDCPVCLSEFEEDERLRLLPDCDHAFHLTCIDNWLRSHKNCPVCRAPVIVNFDGDRSDVSDEASGSGFGDGEIGTEEGGRDVGVWSGKFRVVSDLGEYGRVRVIHHQEMVNKVKRSISMS